MVYNVLEIRHILSIAVDCYRPVLFLTCTHTQRVGLRLILQTVVQPMQLLRRYVSRYAFQILFVHSSVLRDIIYTAVLCIIYCVVS